MTEKEFLDHQHLERQKVVAKMHGITLEQLQKEQAEFNKQLLKDDPWKE